MSSANAANRGAKSQSVLVDDPVLLALARDTLDSMAPAASLCPGQLRRLTQRFNYLKKVLGMEKALVSLGSLRGGGAIQHFRERRNFGVLQIRGRWEIARSMKHYIQMGSCSPTPSRILGGSGACASSQS